MTKTKRSREAMRLMYGRFEQSDKTIKTFCESEGINIHTFQYWRHKFKKPLLKKGVSSTSKAGFQEIRRSAVSSGGVIRIRFLNQTEVELPAAAYSLESLKELLGVLSC